MKLSVAATAIIGLTGAFHFNAEKLTGSLWPLPIKHTMKIVHKIPGTKWVPVALNEANETVSALITTSKGRMIAGTSAGLYLSDDKGRSWKAATTDPNYKAAVFSLTTDKDGTIYAGLSKFGILVSSDNGNSWILYSGGLNKGGPRVTYSLVAIGTVVIKGSFESGAYLSKNKGQDWIPCSDGIPLNLNTSRMVSVTQLSQNSNTVYALTDLGVRYTTDYGKSWKKPLHNGIDRLGYMSCLAAGKNFIATGVMEGNKGVFISTDNGDNWMPAGLEGKGAEALFVAADGSLYAGVKGVIYHTTDKGKTWKTVGTDLPAGTSIYCIGQTPDGKLLAGMNRKGIYLLQ